MVPTFSEDIQVSGDVDFGRPLVVTAPIVKDGKILSSIKFTYDIYSHPVERLSNGGWSCFHKYKSYHVPGINARSRYVTNTTSDNIDVIRDYHRESWFEFPVGFKYPTPIIDFRKRGNYDDYCINYVVRTKEICKEDFRTQSLITEFSFENIYFRQPQMEFKFMMGYVMELYSFYDNDHPPQFKNMHIEAVYEKDLENYKPDFDELVSKIVEYIKKSEKISDTFKDVLNIINFVLNMEEDAFEYVNGMVKESFSDVDVSTVITRDETCVMYNRLPKTYLEKFQDVVL